MPRYKLTVEYDGTPYVGWQRQANGHTVQGAIEAAILAFSGERATLHGAGRTDAGVHAVGQVAHVDLEGRWEPATVAKAVNAHLAIAGERVALVDVIPVGDGFDARFSARRRHYLYRIIDRRAPLAIEAGRAWHSKHALDVAAMHDAAQALVGHHDFTTFRSARCQAKNPERTMERLDVDRNGAVVEIRASARSFLHNQIRSFAGTLKSVGEGKWTRQTVEDVLAARDRRACGPVAPPWGLYFLSVEYPPDTSD